MKKVVHVVHWPKTGITRLLESIFFDIGGRADLHIVFVDAAEEQVDEFRGLAKSVAAGGRDGSLFGKLRRLVAVLRGAKPDIIHTHSFTPSLLVSLFFPRVRHIRTVHSAYPYFSGTSLRDRLKRFIEFRMLDTANTSLVFVADGVKNALPYRFSKAQVATIQNGVNCADIVRRAGSGARVPGEKLVLCSAGRLEHQKGYDLLIEACKLLPAAVRGSMRLLIAGSGSRESALRRQIDEAGLSDVVVLLGYQDNPYPLIAGADICVFSSRYEGFSIAAAEAMALGCPVVTTRVTGIPELLTHGVNAVVADEISPPSLRDAMLMLIEDAALRASIGSRGRELAHERFDIATTSNQYLALYGSE